MEQMLLQAQAQMQIMAGAAGKQPTPNMASVVSNPWAMMGQQGFLQGAPAPQAAGTQQQDNTASSPNQGAAAPAGGEMQQPQQQHGIDNAVLANWMNLQAAMASGCMNPAMMPFMGAMGGGMMPFGFPGFMGQGPAHGGVSNPLANNNTNVGPSPGAAMKGPSK
jgi:hypothetical protein